MSKSRISTIVRENLVTRLEHLQGLLNGSTSRLREGTENLADPLDRATTEHERVVELTIRSRESQEIKEIKEALGRIEKGQFGICTRCGQPISRKRLLLAPVSRLCTTCKSEMEEAQRRPGGRTSGGGVAFGER
jgi:DnaK suppressor protein